jgi:hypothetical protein
MSTTHAMDQLLIVASLLHLLASADAVDDRMVRLIFDDHKPASKSGPARLLTSLKDACQGTL